MDDSSKAWDLSEALKLLHIPVFGNGDSTTDATSPSLASTDTTSISPIQLPSENTISTAQLPPETKSDYEQPGSEDALGNFDPLWEFFKALNKQRNPIIPSSAENAAPVVEQDVAGICSPLERYNDTTATNQIPLDVQDRNGPSNSEGELRKQSTRKIATVGKKWRQQGAAATRLIGSGPLERKAVTIEEVQQQLLSAVSGTPSTQAQHSQAMAAHKNLIPSSIAVSRVQDQSIALEKTAGVMKLLHERFTDPPPIPNNAPGNEGIHIFVDISNILIGFHDTIKRHKGLPKDHRMRRQTLSFFNLSLILQRSRPVAKKILVGSDNFDSIQEAQHLGYTTHILTRVERPERSQRLVAGFSDSDSSRPLRSVKKSEQAVDEILQLHMVNSIIDCDQPSTIVLASGDAAAGEFSDGFLKAVERALRAGWDVEIVSWSRNISSAYRNSKWRSRWGTAFRVIELDDFAELLQLKSN